MARIVETSQWDDADLDILGPALLSLTGHADRLPDALPFGLREREAHEDRRVVHVGGRLGVRPIFRQRQRDARPAPIKPIEEPPSSFKARAGAVRAAFADIEIQVEDLVVEGDSIAWRWALTGTHVGAFAGVAPTDRRIALRGVKFQRLKSDRVVEHWTMVDVYGATQALRAS